MQQRKRFSVSLILILLCVSLLSCQAPSVPEGGETVTAEEVHFRSVICFDPLFEGMTEENCFDVTDFSVTRFNGDGDFTDGTAVVSFSFVPRELRLTPVSTEAYVHNSECFSMLSIDGYRVNEDLERLKDVKPIRFLKPDSTQKDAVLASFSDQYGVAYSLEFTHNGKRDSGHRPISEYRSHYDFLISPLTKNGTYYLCDQNTLIVTEVDGEALSFLEKQSEEWYDCAIFQQHIALVEKIEVSIKDGTTDGVRGVKNLLFEHRNTNQNGVLLTPLEVMNAGSNAVLHVTAHYNGGVQSIGDVLKYRKFYGGILWTEVCEIVLDERRQEQLRASVPDMTVKVFLKCDDYQETLEYRLFADNSVLFNGVYVGQLTDGQLDALTRAAGLVLSPDPSDVIDFW